MGQQLADKLRGLGFGTWIVTVALLGACTAPMRLPDEFLTLAHAQRAGDFRATTGKGGDVWMRQFVERNEGNLEFWAQALEYDFEQRGYQRVAGGECTDASGAAGRWFEYTTGLRGERVGYLVALWVDDRGWRPGCEITTVEFVARADEFAARRDAVFTALATVRR
jgi:hypothetical protein